MNPFYYSIELIISSKGGLGLHRVFFFYSSGMNSGLKKDPIEYRQSKNNLIFIFFLSSSRFKGLWSYGKYSGYLIEPCSVTFRWVNELKVQSADKMRMQTLKSPLFCVIQSAGKMGENILDS